MELFKQILAWLLLIAFGYGLYVFAVNKKGAEEKLTPSPDGTISLSGTVLENYSNCETERCYLVVKSGENTVYVEYDTGDKAFCENELMATKGKGIKMGENVKVYGFYEFVKLRETVRTCPNLSYYIKTL
ncbi:MAG: hypothetical protein WC878_00690 [Candidatus Paceibacterota bacterium]|jgi:hypothetical protein